jgi:hypothetical protein
VVSVASLSAKLHLVINCFIAPTLNSFEEQPSYVQDLFMGGTNKKSLLLIRSTASCLTIWLTKKIYKNKSTIFFVGLVTATINLLRRDKAYKEHIL